MARLALLAGLALLGGAAVAAPPGDAAVAGFHLEPLPAIDEVFGDIESYRRTIDRFVTLTQLMRQRQDEFSRAVQATLLRLQPPVGEKAPKARGCAEAELAPLYGKAQRLGQDYLRAGRELTRHVDQIRDLDRLGDTVGLTPDYRAKVKQSMATYQGLLTDYREMKVAFHDQLAAELRHAGCDLDRLLARAEPGLKVEGFPSPGDPAAPFTPPERREPSPGTKPSQAAEPPPAERLGILIFVDNTRCQTGTSVFIDGKQVASLPAASRAALQTTLGPHDLCLLPDGSKLKCGAPGTVRRSYLHEGWTIALRCQ